jgi:hypothetical protein
MATKKKAATKKVVKAVNKKKKAPPLTMLNLMPLCIQVDLKVATVSPDPMLSVTAMKFPNSVYWVYQDSSIPPNPATVTVDRGYFVGYPGTGTFDLPINKFTGRTKILVLNSKATVGGNPGWHHNKLPISGGGIIIEP